MGLENTLDDLIQRLNGLQLRDGYGKLRLSQKTYDDLSDRQKEAIQRMMGEPEKRFQGNQR